MSAYNGKIAFVDLGSGSILEENWPEGVYRSCLGGSGLGAKVLLERMRPGIDPLGPESLLGFLPGLLSGTSVPMASKYTVLAKSPLTGAWGDASSGGFFGPALKTAGYDAIFFTGVAPEPVYALVENNRIDLRKAEHLWGMDTMETVDHLTRETGIKRPGISCIGPAGEKRALISSIISDHARAAGRSGLGAVMGSKRLKAVIVNGTDDRALFDRVKFGELKKSAISQLDEVDKVPFIRMLKATGTCAAPAGLVPAGISPVKNWTLRGEAAFPEYASIAGQNVTKYQKGKSGCGNCPINCGGSVRVEQGPYAAEGRKPEYETLAAFGPMLLNSNIESIIKANDLCDRFGLDTISAGSAIAFAMECFEKEIIGREETGGLDLTWGNPDVILDVLRQMGRREGIGGLLAGGVRKAAATLGRGAEECAIHIHGQEPPFHDPRAFGYRGLGYISGAAPGRHMISMASIRLEQEGTLGHYLVLQKPKEGNEREKKARIHALGLAYSQAFSDCGLCLFALTAGTRFPLVEFIHAVTGWDVDAAEVLRSGKRTLTLRQLFNAREGLTSADFTLPSRLSLPPEQGPFSKVKIEFEQLRKDFFQEMKWDPDTGIPSKECLEELQINDLIHVLR